MNEQGKQKGKILVGLIISWVLAIIFFLIGIFSIFSNLLSGLTMLIMAIVIFPPVTKIVYKKWKFSIPKGIKIGVIVIGLIIVGAMIDSSSTSSNIQQIENHGEQQSVDNENMKNEVAIDGQIDGRQSQIENNEKEINEADITANLNEEVNKNTEEVKSSIPVANQSPTLTESENKSEPIKSETVSQRNAVRSAKSYLGYSAFSRSGLIKQLEYEKFSNSDAVYGVDNSGVDWYKQAVKSAMQYMDYSSFSRDSLIDQLKYEGFTQAQAEYGASAVGF